MSINLALSFFHKKQSSENDWESDEEYEEIPESEGVLFCDVCEEDFYSENSYEKHISEHKVCGLDGCQYTAHPNMIEKHIETQHLTGLYEKIRSVNTPEEIAKWVEQRKVRYPTKENIQKRYERQEEMLKRGEKIRERRNRFGRDRTRLSRVQQRRTVKKKKPAVKMEQKPKESLIDEKCDWNGTMFPFRGTKDLFNEEVEKEMSDYDDEEWSMETSNTKVSVKINNALGALMGAYMSDEEDEGAQNNSDDDGPPIEMKIEKQTVEYPCEQPNEVKVVKRSKKRKHVAGKKQSKKICLDSKKLQTGFSRMKFFRRRVTLLEKLLDSEIRHERNILLQCVQFVVDNNFFMNDNSTAV